jgi:hypothetical protein
MGDDRWANLDAVLRYRTGSVKILAAALRVHAQSHGRSLTDDDCEHQIRELAQIEELRRAWQSAA